VGPHTDLLDAFPFLGPPNTAMTGAGPAMALRADASAATAASQ
jgi:hypothetical protein